MPTSPTLDRVVTKNPDIVYEELGAMQVTLDSDPIAFGPKRLNEKISQVRAHLSRCERIFLQVSQDLHLVKREHRRLEAEFKMQFQELLATDPEVRAGRNVTDREAIANMRLRSEIEEISSLSFAVQDLETVMIVIKTKRTDLKDTQSRLKDQLKICQEEISLGAHWGSRSPSAKPKEIERNQGFANAADSMNIHNMLDTLEGELHLVDASQVTATSSTVEVPVTPKVAVSPSVVLEKFKGNVSSDAEADAFLASLDIELESPAIKPVVKPQVSTLNVDDFLESLSL
jgi:hypothetical protein